MSRITTKEELRRVIAEPRPATHVVPSILPAVAVSTRHWADTFPRLASMPLRPWKARSEPREPVA